MQYRKMTLKDYPALITLWSSFPGTTMTGADEEQEFETFITRNSSFCLVAETEDTVTGSVMGGHDTRRGYVYHLAVHPDFQNRGIARELMDRIEDAFREDGIEKVHLFIYTDNPAIKFYRKIGWHLRKDICVMSKVLIGDKYTGTRLN